MSCVIRVRELKAIEFRPGLINLQKQFLRKSSAIFQSCPPHFYEPHLVLRAARVCNLLQYFQKYAQDWSREQAAFSRGSGYNSPFSSAVLPGRKKRWWEGMGAFVPLKAEQMVFHYSPRSQWIKVKGCLMDSRQKNGRSLMCFYVFFVAWLGCCYWNLNQKSYCFWVFFLVCLFFWIMRNVKAARNPFWTSPLRLNLCLGMFGFFQGVQNLSTTCLFFSAIPYLEKGRRFFFSF